MDSMTVRAVSLTSAPDSSESLTTRSSLFRRCIITRCVNELVGAWKLVCIAGFVSAWTTLYLHCDLPATPTRSRSSKLLHVHYWSLL